MKECWFVGAVLFFFKHVDNVGVTRFLAFVDVMKQHSTARHDKKVPIVKRHPVEGISTSNRKYAVINVEDITNQVGLVPFAEGRDQFYVIAPYIVFDVDLHDSAGKIVML